MADYFFVKINIDRLENHLSTLFERPYSHSETVNWLKEKGFEPDADRWRVDSLDLHELLPEEILEVISEDEPASAADAAPTATGLPNMHGDWGGELYYFRPPSPVMTPTKSSDLRKLPGHDRCVIPRFMLEARRIVQRRVDSLVKRAVRQMSWEEALKSEEFVHIDAVPGWIITAPLRVPYPSQDHQDAIIHLIWGRLQDAVYVGQGRMTYAQYHAMRDLILQGMEHFWFAIHFMTIGIAGLPLRHDIAGREDHAAAAREFVRKLLYWWPHIVAREYRLVECWWHPLQWPRWRAALEDLYPLLGVEEPPINATPDEVERVLSLAVSGDRNGIVPG